MKHLNLSVAGRTAILSFSLFGSLLGGCAISQDADEPSESSDGPRAATDLALRYAGDYMTFIDSLDISVFNRVHNDYVSLELRPDGTFAAVVTARRATTPGHVTEQFGGAPWLGFATFAAESGSWTVLPGDSSRVFDPQWPTLVIQPSGLAERRYSLGPLPPGPFTPLSLAELAPAGVIPAKDGFLYQASFFKNAPQYRICLGGKPVVSTPNGPRCAESI